MADSGEDLLRQAAAQLIADGETTVWDAVWISGVHERAITIETDDGTHLVSVRFTPFGLRDLLGVSTGRLRSLDKTGVVTPSGRRRGRRAYTFQDLIALRAARDLLAKKVRDSRTAYPSDADLERGEFQTDVGDALPLYEQYWSKLKAAR